jgi:hypothetical protein
MKWVKLLSSVVVLELVIGLAVAGIGGFLYYRTNVHEPDRIPAGGIQIEIGPTYSLNVSNTAFTASAAGNNSVTVEIEFQFKEIRTYYLLVILPFVVIEKPVPFVTKHGDSYRYGPGSVIGDLQSDFKPFPRLGSSVLNASFTPNGIYLGPWERYVTLGTTAYVDRLVARKDSSTATVILTFFGDIMQIRDPEMDKWFRPPSLIPMHTPFSVIVEFPSEAFLSSETYPSPIQYYVTNRSRVATFTLNFTCPRFECAQTVSCSFVYPSRAGDVQTMIFWSGIMVGLGAPLVFEGAKDALRSLRFRDFLGDRCKHAREFFVRRFFN